jgi:hypothetical protein
VYVRPFLRDGPAIQVSTTDSSSPLWSHDGTELYYLSKSKSRGRSRRSRFGREGSLGHGGLGDEHRLQDRCRTPRAAVLRKDYMVLIPLRSWDMGPDGRFLMARHASDDVVREAMDAFFPNRIRLIQNWASTLESGER